MHVSVDIDLNTAENGGEIQFQAQRLKVGSNNVASKVQQNFRIKLKPNVQHGTVKRLKQQGNEHPQGVPGDLHVTLRIDAGEGRRWGEWYPDSRNCHPLFHHDAWWKSQD